MQIESIVDLQYPLYAHCPQNEEQKNKESLLDHLQCCLKYYKKYNRSKQALQRIFENFFESDKKVEKFFFDAVQLIIELHDVGKINPLFQKEKMKNDLKFSNISVLKGANHSFLSAFIYLDYLCEKLDKLECEKNTKRKMKMFLFINSYIISRHHGDLSDLEFFIESFEEGGEAECLVQYFDENTYEIYKGPFFFSSTNILVVSKYYRNGMKNTTRKQKIIMNAYIRLLYSILTTVDYYATAEYETNLITETQLCEEKVLYEHYEKQELTKKIRDYKKKNNVMSKNDINQLRTELFLDVEEEWKKHKKDPILFLEAPTGSGKSNCAVNLSVQMVKEGYEKIWYIYPFNTLVEQNYQSLEKIFGQNSNIFSKIAVINSITPMKKDYYNKGKNEEDSCYQKALLDRQFLNYPFLLSTHVFLFETMFSNRRESVFGFSQLINSVIVLDEIQSYKNKIWSEIIIFLEVFAQILNIRVLIMSATLPNLEVLTGKENNVTYLVKNREKYFNDPIFKDRVKISYKLLQEKITIEELYSYICENTPNGKKVLLEFIKKDTAYTFFQMAYENKQIFEEIYCLTGDDNIIERKNTLSKIAQMNGKTILLISTQIIEAGVDIDMDIGYKDISKLDSEEQFLGRINRSCKREGVAYFFNLDDAERIYKDDIRINKKFTLYEEKQQEILKNKKFEQYYLPILRELQSYNKRLNENNLEDFFEQDVANGEFRKIAERMKLIDEDNWNMSIYLSRIIILENGEKLDGWECWNKYKSLLLDRKMNYARKQYELSVVRSKMNYFIYQVQKNIDLNYSDCIGDLYAIQEGEKYFLNGKINKKLLQENGITFVEI